MEQKNKVIIFNVYLLSLIFTILNRSFEPFGIDLRVVVLFLALTAMVSSFITQKIRLVFDFNTKAVLGLYFFVIIGAFYQTTINVDENVYQNVLGLNLYCLFNVIVLALFQQKIDIRKVKKYFDISWLFLFISILITAMGFNLPFNNYQSFSGGLESDGGIRFCGYGSDPNYVCVIAIIYIILTYIMTKNKTYKRLAYFSAFSVLALARSRSAISIAVLMLIISIIAKHVNTQTRKWLFSCLFIILLVLPLIMLIIRPFNNNISMSIRYTLWSRAFNNFLNHPFLGNGLMSTRNISYYASNWFVQCHSTYFQLLCDHGIFALILYFIIYYHNIMININNPIKYCFLIYFIWSFTYETMYLTYTILFFGLLPYCTSQNEDGINEKK